MPSYYDSYRPPPPKYVPHGPECGCDVCAGQRLQNQERLSSTDRLAWLEKQVIELQANVKSIKTGKSKMGVALWCTPGDHSFDENAKGKRRMTVDEYDENDEPTGREITAYVCPRHKDGLLKPQPKSLTEIQQQINEATVIGE